MKLVNMLILISLVSVGCKKNVSSTTKGAPSGAGSGQCSFFEEKKIETDEDKLTEMKKTVFLVAESLSQSVSDADTAKTAKELLGKRINSPNPEKLDMEAIYKKAISEAFMQTSDIKNPETQKSVAQLATDLAGLAFEYETKAADASKNAAIITTLKGGVVIAAEVLADSVAANDPDKRDAIAIHYREMFAIGGMNALVARNSDKDGIISNLKVLNILNGEGEIGSKVLIDFGKFDKGAAVEKINELIASKSPDKQKVAEIMKSFGERYVAPEVEGIKVLKYDDIASPSPMLHYKPK